MPYNSIISRTDAQALIPERLSLDVLGPMTEQSAALRLFRTVRMGTAQTRMPVVSALPLAYFVTGDTGLKQTTEVNWDSVYLNAEEIAAIVPIPIAVVQDAGFDPDRDLAPYLREAIGRTLDAAIFFGTNAPASWPDDLATAAVAAGNTVTAGTAAAAAGGIAEDLNDVIATVEADGFDVNGMVANRTFRATLRGLRDSTGQKLLDVTTNTVEGITVNYTMSGLWPTGTGAVLTFVGDFTQGVIGIRQDVELQVFSEGVIQDNTGTILYNLLQMDMLAVRVTARFAFATPNPINRAQGTAASRYAWGVLRAA
jgi:HK97 family phage major capsid protein